MKALLTTKVITVMLVLCALSVFAGTAQSSTTLFSDGFESGDFTAGGWTKPSHSTKVSVTTDSNYTGTYGARITASASSSWLTKSESTQGYNTIHVLYDRKTTYGDIVLVVRWSSDGGSTWTNLETVNASAGWASENWTLPSSADNDPNFLLQFITTTGTGSHYAYIDNVKITGNDSSVSPPGKAISPTPANLATNVVVTTDLSWAAGTGATSHDVYFGTTSTPPLVSSNQASNTYDTGTMANGTTYYWRIDEENAGGTTTGDVWSFTTKAQVPNVLNMTQAAAGSAITGAGLVVGTVTQQCSDTVAAGNVISQDPIGGTQVNVGSAVNLVVSSGQPSVPNVVGQTQAAAIAAIGAVANISYGSSTTQCSAVAAGNVISQSATGTVSCGTVVNLVVSSGQPSVPSVVGSTEANAIAAIGAVANISYGSSATECNDTVATGNVISQSATGTVSCGTVVNLVVSSGPCLRTISGYVTEPDVNIPVEGVLVDANNNGGGTDTTDANCYYKIVVPYNWSGTATPIKEGYTFEPNNISYNNVVADEVNDYTATLMTFNIAGYVFGPDLITPISDVNVSAENGGGPWTSKYGGGSSLTDSGGYYEVWVDYNWSGKVTPAKYAYVFEPNGISYEDVNADFAGQDYAGTLLTFKITGYITNECNVPISDVLVSADNGGGQAMTDANGFYDVWVSYAWSGTVTPEKLYYTFNPVGLSYVGVLVDQVEQNYTADNIYDLDCDGYIDLGDVKVMCDNWLTTGSKTPIPGDFDADGTVNFTDFAIFANAWGD